MKRFIKRIPSDVLLIICAVSSLFIEYPHPLNIYAWTLAALMLILGVTGIVRNRHTKK